MRAKKCEFHPRLRYGSEIVEECLRLHREGKSNRKIALALGVSRWSVREWIAGIKRPEVTRPRQRAKATERWAIMVEDLGA